MVDYIALAATAKRLIDAAGRDITLTKKDRSPADPNTPWRAGGVTDTTIGPFKGVVVPYEEKDVDGSIVRRGDRMALISGLDGGTNLVEQFDSLVDNGTVWKIQGVDVVNPGDTRVLYTLQLRK